MDTRRILVAYDATPGAEASLYDLDRAGLPADAETLIAVAAEHLPEGWSPGLRAVAGPASAHGAHGRAFAVTVAEHAASLLRARHPGWSVRIATPAGHPVHAILELAEEWRPDVIVVGWNESSQLRRMLHRGLSLAIAQSAHQTVRVARASEPVRPGGLRLLLGIDGSWDACCAVHLVADRHWPAGTAVRVFAALEHADALDLELEEQEDPPLRLGGRADCLSQAVVELQNRGLIVSGVMRTESPERVLLRQAADWRADAIFIGASTAQPRGAHNTAWEVIEQACCPVEIVRAGEHALHPVVGWAH